MGMGLFVLGHGALSADRPEEQRVLRILNWAEYIELDDEADASLSVEARSPVLKAFAEEFECEIVYQENDDAVESWENLKAAPGFFDLICVGRTDAADMLEAGLIESIDEAHRLKFDNTEMSEVFPSICGRSPKKATTATLPTPSSIFSPAPQ